MYSVLLNKIFGLAFIKKKVKSIIFVIFHLKLLWSKIIPSDITHIWKVMITDVELLRLAWEAEISPVKDKHYLL